MSFVATHQIAAAQLSAEDDARLYRHWQSLFEPFASSVADRGRAYADLTARHREGHRAYHDLNRVLALVNQAERLALPFAEPDVVGLSIWFHASIYQPTARDNAERSAALAQEMLPTLGVPRRKIDRVATAILATRRHVATEYSFDQHGFLDLDMAVFGAEPTVYERYRQAVRTEFSWVADTLYRAGRRRMCLAFLARPQIYFTDLMRRRYEDRARANLEAELAML